MAERLDFGSGDGGGLTTDMSTDEEMVETAAKRRRLESDHDSARQIDQPESMDTDSPAVNKSLSEFSSSQLDTHDLEIIDELGGEQDEDATYAENRLDQSGDEGSEVSEYDLDDEEIDALLEEGIEAERKGTDGQPEGDAPNAAMRRNKIVLREKGQNPFEILPEGWVTVTHNSGMPVYLHRKSRVCTISKPYFLGSGSARKHEIPLSAVPCLHYRRELQKEQGIHNGGQEAKLNGVSSLSNNTDTSGDLNKESCDDTAQPLPSDVTPAPAPPLPSDDLQAPPLPSDDLPVPPPLPVDPPPSPPPDSTAPPLPDQPPESSAVSNGVDACPQASGVSCNGTTNMDSAANQGSAGETTTSAVPVKIESAEERNKVTSLGPMEFRAYCRRLFQFKVITVVKYKTWKDRRKHHSMLKKQNRPGLPGNTRLITCPIPSEKGDEKKKEFVLNPSGKSYVCILHEYVQHAMRVQPRYIFKELENAQTPYSATVVIDDVEYGTGYASSKKAAKMDAAKSTLSILIPEMVKVTQDENNKDTEDLSFFDEIKIEDPRIYELCTKAGQPSPYQILQECLKRNYGMGDTQCKMEMKQLKHQKNEFYMSVGKHEAKVSCKNKREGKQYAAQAILQLLHPHVQSWGSLLRLYGRRSCNVIKEKKQEEQEITHLQLNARANRPNTAVLEKLKEEMTKLREQKEAIPSKGTIRVSTQELPANVTSINL